MNERQFEIYGPERRELKKKLSLMKRDIGSYWWFNSLNDDMYGCYGHENPYTKDRAERDYNKVLSEIEALEKELSVPYVNV